MNIKAIFVAVTALALSAGAMTAQTPANQTRKERTAKTTRLNGYVCKNDSAPCPFSSLNLSADQKSKIQALDTNMQAQRKERRDSRQAQRSNSRKEYLAGLKSILTPEQYTQFLEDSFVNKAMKPSKRGDRNRADRSGRPERRKDSKRGNRPAPQQQAAQAS